MRSKLFSVAGLAVLAALGPTATRESPVGEVAGDPPFVGVSIPCQVAAVAPEQSGKIVAIPVADGARVAKDDVLFRLSSKLEQLEVDRLRELAESDLIHLRAQASLRHAEVQEGRIRDLRDKEISSDSDLQAQAHEVEQARLRLRQAGLEQAQARNELAQAMERLEQRTVRSPFDGIVTQRFKSEGEAVEKFVPVLEVMTIDPLWIEFDCPVADEQLFRVGTEVKVSPAVRPDETRVARVLFISTKANASSHTFLVRVAVTNADLRWKTGLKMLIQRPADPEDPRTLNPSKPPK